MTAFIVAFAIVVGFGCLYAYLATPSYTTKLMHNIMRDRQ